MPAERARIRCAESGRKGKNRSVPGCREIGAVGTGDTARKLAPLTQGMGINGWTEEVPVFVVISQGTMNLSARAGMLLKNNDYRSIDLGIACAYLTAEATEMGLSSCIIGWFREKAVRRLIGCKGKPRLIVALGYPKTDSAAEKREKARKSADSIIKWV